MATDPLAGSELARVPLPDNVYGFGWAEIRYLLGRHSTDSSVMTRTSLGFDAAPDDEVLVAAAVASLLARGLAAAEGDRAVSRGEAAVLETVFAGAKRWTGISFRDGTEGDLMVVLEDGGIIAMLQPRSLGTWFVGLTDEVDQPAAVLARAIEAMHEVRGGAGRFGVETRTLEGAVGTRFFTPAGDGWSVSDTADGPARALGDGGLAGELAALLPEGSA
ncbi:hypothetical protein [Humibacillus xanthopallidus]|uniref:Uncharacterized protein n=1 Tax=Humibacillus xanthopallidus TaxID=412689 RepID=A0A543I0J5_9MICO|nr:hypothetical protein [Humibacillus xanthopallidus]TQM64118.1 hypothetical protein FBY41_0478 [Humibacillus xanthopallidus]